MPVKSKGTGKRKKDKRGGEERRSEDCRAAERRLAQRRKYQRRYGQRRKEYCPTCKKLLTLTGYCRSCRVRVIKIRPTAK